MSASQDVWVTLSEAYMCTVVVDWGWLCLAETQYGPLTFILITGLSGSKEFSNSSTLIKCTVGSKSVDDALYILKSCGCRAASWHLRSICNSGLATDSSVAWHIPSSVRYFTNRYKWLWNSRPWDWCWIVSLSDDLLTDRSSVCLDKKLHKNLWLGQWGTKVNVFLQMKQQVTLDY